MRIINISIEEIVEGFKQLGLISSSFIHKDLVEYGTIKQVDNNLDIEIFLSEERFWITTEINLRQYNKRGDYLLVVEYNIHKDSKYSDIIDSFERTL